MEANKPTTRIIAQIVAQVGLFAIQRDFEVTRRDPEMIFAESKDIIQVVFFDIREVSIDGVKYTSDPINVSPTFCRDGSIEEEHVATPSENSFFAAGSTSIN